MSEHQVNRSGVCEIPGCPCRGWSAQETASVKEVDRLHTDDCVRQRAKFGARSLAGDVCSCGADQPAARGGGDDGELRPGMNPTCLRCFNDGWNAHRQGLHPANFHAGFATQDAPHTCNQHQSLVAERDRLRDTLRIIRDIGWTTYMGTVKNIAERALATDDEQRSTSE